MSHIRGGCHTNLDDYRREEWPNEFVSVPIPGECMRAKSGRILKVCRVTHCYGNLSIPSNFDVLIYCGPYIEVELTKVV